MATTDVDRRLGRRVREVRKAAGLSQEQLAEAIGRSVDTISNLEREAASTRISTVGEIAAALGVDVAELFRLPGDAPRPEMPEAMVPLFDLLADQPPSLIEAVLESARLLVKVRDQARKP